MPRYFFNIHREGATSADSTGRELADARAAKQHAEEIIRDFAEHGKPIGGLVGWVEVLDEDQKPVVRLPLDEIAAG